MNHTPLALFKLIIGTYEITITCILLLVTIYTYLYSTLDDEPIYGNMGYEWKGYNIGERWENYQKTKTILRNGQ